MFKRAITVLTVVVVVVCFTFLLSSPAISFAKAKSITFGDFSWDSVQIHNRIAGYVLEKAYGYRVSYSFGESLPLLLGMARGDVDVSMEIWSDNIEAWGKYVESGECLDLGPTYSDAGQGWYVPHMSLRVIPKEALSQWRRTSKVLRIFLNIGNFLRIRKIRIRVDFTMAPQVGWLAL